MKFKKKESAEQAIKEMNEAEWMDKKLEVDWAFLDGPSRTTKA